eukprot:CAMPEP_0175149406 /NCGR_PEP_ID=MMETSP0087-20121206/17230_1 /TAXON_ID=136419 /ORGANISM="Unknown Unknown, Strain D1" /LENGTH=319 /DNA_ID=CAMNT_0016435103 /DNA_START=122 /DNA_END=1081 /DNA_ORIENTATION=-
MWALLYCATDGASPGSPPTSQLVKQFLAGGLAGVVSKTAVAPLERMRNMVMSGTADDNQGYLGLLLQLVRAEGVSALWRGNATKTVQIFPSKAIDFMAHDYVSLWLTRRRKRQGRQGSLSTAEQLLAGAVAGFVSTAAVHPLEVITLKQSLGSNKSLLSLARAIVRSEGVRGLYVGIGPLLGEEMLTTGLGFWFYNFGLRTFASAAGRQARASERAVVGALAGLCVSTLTMPLVVLQKRMIGQQQSGTLKLAYRILRNEGLGAFFNGMVLTWTRVLPMVGLVYFVYEMVSARWGLGGLARYRKNDKTDKSSSSSSSSPA